MIHFKVPLFLKKLNKASTKSTKRFLIISLLSVFILLTYLTLYHHVDVITSVQDNLSYKKVSTGKQNFNNIIMKINQEYNPHVTYPASRNFQEKDTRTELVTNSLGSYKDRCPTIGQDTNDVKNWKKLSRKYLSNECLIVNENIKKQLRDSHTRLINALIDETDDTFIYQGKEFYSGDGIVFVGGGSYSLMTYSVIKTIRKSGTTLPIEVLIPTEEEATTDAEFCSLIESHNAKCIYLSRIFSQDLLKTNEFKGFQYKSLALFASSFENVLLLDADDYPLKNLDTIFDHNIFKKSGLILWPDFWRRTTNPYFYESAGVEVDTSNKMRNSLDTVSNLAGFIKDLSPEDTPFHDFVGTIPDPSSETGQMMISKKLHWKTLLLSMYYNIYGPNVYYHLLSQYSSGQGDKETFIAAAHLLKLPYYQIFSSSSVDGYFTEEGDFRGLTYYQKDFRHDYETKKKIADDIRNLNNVEDLTYVKKKYFSGELSEDYALFAHCNLPKFHPLQMAVNDEFIRNDLHYRGYTHKKCLAGLDLEQEINLAYKELLCQPGKTAFDYMFKDKEKLIMCNYIKKRLALFEKEPLFD